MKQYFKSVIATVAFLFASGVQAQNQSSLLWEISGNGLEHPSFLFGTIHLICEEDYIMSEVIENKIKEAQAFYAELDFSNMSEIMYMQQSMMVDTPLSQRLPKEKYDRLASLLQENMNLDIQTFENLSEAAIASSITIQSFACEKHKMYEMELLQMALRDQKKLGGLESVKEQMELLNGNFEIDVLIDMLEEYKKDGPEFTKKMIKLYRSQNIEELLSLMNQTSYMTDQAFNEMLVKRNHNWVEKMPTIMKNHSTFFAVGAAHLGGKQGVIQLLRENGFTVTPIHFQ